MKYMLMMHHAGQGAYAMESWPKEDIQAHIGFMIGFAQRLMADGELVAADGLAAPSQAVIVRAGADGRPVTDGVFPETKEFLVGYWLVEVSDTARAHALAAEASAAPGRGGRPLNLAIEVRQVMSAPPEDLMA